MIEKLDYIQKKDSRKNTVSERLYFEVFYFLVKAEFLCKKIKDKKHYIKLKNLTFHITKTELKETYQMIKLLLKKERTKEEQKFIEEQLKDLGRIGLIGTVGVLPGGMIIGIVLQKLGLKYSVSAYDEFIEKE